MKWKNVTIPNANFELTLREDTSPGRNLLKVTGKFPFSRDLFSSCVDRTPGYLRVRDLGPILCRVSHVEVDWGKPDKSNTEVSWDEVG